MDHTFVAKRHEIVGHGERRGARADERDAFAVLDLGRLREEFSDIVAQICRDPLQSADRDGLSIDAGTAARGLARAVTGAAKDAGEDVRLPVEQIRLGESPLRDQPNVFGHVRVCGTRELAVDNLMVVFRIVDVCGLHAMWMIAYGRDSGK